MNPTAQARQLLQVWQPATLGGRRAAELLAELADENDQERAEIRRLREAVGLSVPEEGLKDE